MSGAPGQRARDYRREVYDLRETSRALSSRITVRTCGVWQSYGRRGTEDAGTIDLAVGSLPVTRDRTRVEGSEWSEAVRAKVLGAHACGSVWECPVCHGRISGSRAVEVRQFAETARERGFVLRMITLTIRHAVSDDVDVTTSAVADAWRAVLQSRAVRELRKRERWHMVRALELKHGANGWHPHLHVLVAIEKPIPRSDRDENRVQVIERAWIPACARLAEESNRPLAGVAVVQTPIDPKSADYLTKLGLELTDTTNKTRGASRSPFEILSDAREDARERERRARERWLEHGDELELRSEVERSANERLWQSYAIAMVGHRQLTWGRGVRRIFGLAVEPSEEDIATETFEAQDRVVFSVDADLFRAEIASRKGLLEQVLCALELVGVGEALATISSYHGARGDEVVSALVTSHVFITRNRERLRARQTGDPVCPREYSLRL